MTASVNATGGVTSNYEVLYSGEGIVNKACWELSVFYNELAYV
jgi:hypothetical protein